MPVAAEQALPAHLGLHGDRVHGHLSGVHGQDQVVRQAMGGSDEVLRAEPSLDLREGLRRKQQAAEGCGTQG